jgi:hypothetical protein
MAVAATLQLSSLQLQTQMVSTLFSSVPAVSPVSPTNLGRHLDVRA